MPIVKSLGSALVCVGGHRREAGGRSRRGESRAEPAHPARSARLTAPAALGGGQSAASSLAFAAGPTPPCCLTAGLARASVALAWRSEFSPPGPGPLQGARKPASEEEQEARAAGRVLASFRPPDALLSCRRPRERLPTFVSFYFYRSRGKTASYSLDLHRPVWRPLLHVAAEHSKRVQPKSRCFRGNIKRTLGFEESVAEKAKYLINDILC